MNVSLKLITNICQVIKLRSNTAEPSVFTGFNYSDKKCKEQCKIMRTTNRKVGLLLSFNKTTRKHLQIKPKNNRPSISRPILYKKLFVRPKPPVIGEDEKTKVEIF